jgi:hypothetical protein
VQERCRHLSAEDAAHHPRANIITEQSAPSASRSISIKSATGYNPATAFCAATGFRRLFPKAISPTCYRAETPSEHLIAAALVRRVDDNVTAVAVEVLPNAA